MTTTKQLPGTSAPLDPTPTQTPDFAEHRRARVADLAADRDVRTWTLRDWERHLGDSPAIERFSVAEIDGLPEPVRRYFRWAIAIPTPLVSPRGPPRASRSGIPSRDT